MVAGAASMFVWAYAYYIFPRTIHRITKGVDVGPFAIHLTAMAKWVKLCGDSHIIMGGRDLAMLMAMYLMMKGVYIGAVVFLWVTLWPLYVCGLYSLRRIKELDDVAPSINRLIRAANGAIDGY